MSKITKRTIENVKNGVNILDLAQEYFSLKEKEIVTKLNLKMVSLIQ